MEVLLFDLLDFVSHWVLFRPPNRARPPGPVCGRESRLQAMGAQQNPPVHPVAVLALPDAPELHPAGQRRLPARQILHGTRFRDHDTLVLFPWEKQIITRCPLYADLFFFPPILPFTRFRGESKPKLPSGSPCSTPSQPELHPAEEVNPGSPFLIRFMVSNTTEQNYVLFASFDRRNF